jgi:small-conductance mechanosensitive channel
MTDWLIALAWVGGGLLIGLIIDRVFMRRYIRQMTRTRWGADDVAVGAVRTVVVPWFVIGGAFGARLNMPFTPGLARVIDRILLVLLILSVTIGIARLVRDIWKLAALRSEGAMRSSSIFSAITSLVIYAVGFMVLLQTLGVSITPMITALGVGGLAAALALQDTLANLFAGIHLIASKKFRPGDYILMDTGQEGYVIDVNWRNTELRQLPNNMVLVPNAKLAAAVVTNYAMPDTEMNLQIEIGVSYDSDLSHVEEVVLEVARQVLRDVPGGVIGFEPKLRYHTFGDSSIDMTVVLRVQQYVDRFPIQHAFIKRIHARFAEEGIEIPFPIRTVHLKQIGDGAGEVALGDPGT